MNDFAITSKSWTFLTDDINTLDGLVMLFIDILLFNALGMLIDYYFNVPKTSELLSTKKVPSTEVELSDLRAIHTNKSGVDRSNYLEVQDL